MRRVDVSMPLAAGMPAFPGDPAFRSLPVRSLAAGDPYNLSVIQLGTHAGTHVDPPSHFVAGATPVDRLDVALLNGPCEVVSVPERVTVVDAAACAPIPAGTERVLVRTANSPRWTERLAYFDDYVGLDLSGARALRARGVLAVGIDALSIERDATGTFPVHHELLAHGVAVVEGLLLDEAEPGRAELRCLPLRLRDGAGGPARAFLEYP